MVILSYSASSTVTHPADEITAGTFPDNAYTFEGSLWVGVNLGVGNNLVVDNDLYFTDDDWIGIGSASERIVFDSDGDDISFMGADVGIGTETPASKLMVQGGLIVCETGDCPDPGDGSLLVQNDIDVRGEIKNNIADTPTTIGDDLNVEGTLQICDAYGENCGAVTGGGGVWTESDSNVYRDSGNVGIGVTSPTEALVVDGKIAITELLYYDTDYEEVDGSFFAGSCAYGVRSINSLGQLSCTETRWTAGDNILYRTTGNVGIGTDSPQAKLDVQGGGANIAEHLNVCSGTNNCGLAIMKIGGNYWQWHHNTAGTLTLVHNTGSVSYALSIDVDNNMDVNYDMNIDGDASVGGNLDVTGSITSTGDGNVIITLG